MKFLLLFVSVVLPSLAWGHCPIELEVKGQEYCLDLQWGNGEKKVQGKFESSNDPSPHLVAMGTVPQKWIYSKAEFSIWKKGDSSHLSQAIENFRIFPYMQMESGHHHSASYDFSYNEGMLIYSLSSVAFQEMPGCWSFRWTTHENDEMGTSSLLTNITDYKNLADDENETVKGYCGNAEQPGGGAHEHH